eukprot:TRINITY_DN8902_c0_g1_i2.p1 TRINITY_DN8902_c0_g1~~TRINITY_DN8902_c0_g1_i2.p1  ORF type:complete len:485 (-),score=49.54 TRINITY_DN8902_c0_g1_i2:220-1674(-)
MSQGFVGKDVRITLQNGVVLDARVESSTGQVYVLSNVSSSDVGGISVPSLRVEKSQIKQIGSRMFAGNAVTTVAKPEPRASATSDSFTEVTAKKKQTKPASPPASLPAEPAPTPGVTKPKMDHLSMAAKQMKYIMEFKTVMCAEVLRVKWCSDKWCFFAHSEYELRRVPTKYIYSPDECPDFRSSSDRCPRGNSCPFAHGRYEIMYHPEIFKTKTCEEYMKKQTCVRQDGCAFAHGVRELRKPVPIEQLASVVDSMPEFRRGGAQPTPASASRAASQVASSKAPVSTSSSSATAAASAAKPASRPVNTVGSQSSSSNQSAAAPPGPMMGSVLPPGQPAGGRLVPAFSGQMMMAIPSGAVMFNNGASAPGQFAGPAYVMPTIPGQQPYGFGAMPMFLMPPGATQPMMITGQMPSFGTTPLQFVSNPASAAPAPQAYNPMRAQMASANKDATDSVTDAMGNLNIEVSFSLLVCSRSPVHTVCCCSL